MAEVHLRRITADNAKECLDLRVAETQQRFVTTNAQSLAQAKANPSLVPLGVYDREARGWPRPRVPMIGFVMYEIDCGVGSILRLMIDRVHQRQGYGRGMGLGVRADAPKPDIGSAEGLKRALLAAKSIAITDPATGGLSGVHIAEVFQRLGITEELKPKLKLNRGGPNAAFVARGEADMAIQLAHEIRAVPGIDFIPLPVEFQRTFVFSAGLAPNANESAPAKALLQFLAGQEGMIVIRAKGMDPVARR